MAEPDLDLDNIMQRIREELEQSYTPPVETPYQTLEPASAARNPIVALLAENTPRDARQSAKPKRSWKRRLDPRRFFHRMLGLREVAKLEPVLRTMRRAAMPVSAIPAAVNALRSSVADLRTAVLNMAANSVDVAKFDALRREFDELRLATARDEAASGRQLALEASRKSAELYRQIDELAAKYESVEARLSESESLLQISSAGVAKCEAVADDHERKLGDIRAIIDQLDRKVLDHWRHIADQNRRLALLLSEVRRKAQVELRPSDIAAIERAVDQQLSALYVSLEDADRGTRGEIMERQKVYLPRVQQAVDAPNAGPVVDLGCGRGEFLELLRAEGIRALGVDQNGVMVSECKSMGLDAVESEIIAYLKAQPASSISALTSFHVVERLPNRTLIEFLDDAFRVIAPGGVLILETPNPANLIVATERFHLDPTRLKPLPSELLGFLAEARGFVDIEVTPLHPVAAPRLQYDDELMRLLHDKVYGPQAYGLIARKAK